MQDKPLEIRKIRLPEDKIKICDGKEESEPFSDILEKLPRLGFLYGLNKINCPELFEIHKNLVCGVDQREDDATLAIRE